MQTQRTGAESQAASKEHRVPARVGSRASPGTRRVRLVRRDGRDVSTLTERNVLDPRRPSSFVASTESEKHRRRRQGSHETGPAPCAAAAGPPQLFGKGGQCRSLCASYKLGSLTMLLPRSRLLKSVDLGTIVSLWQASRPCWFNAACSLTRGGSARLTRRSPAASAPKAAPCRAHPSSARRGEASAPSAQRGRGWAVSHAHRGGAPVADA